ncbi:hypothetical protein DWUX_1094 [Desulfovibrio diazotrophicus]|nr:hypothetical protein DWUX_1094 [Desulfovibrio diazotrophicus]
MYSPLEQITFEDISSQSLQHARFGGLPTQINCACAFAAGACSCRCQRVQDKSAPGGNTRQLSGAAKSSRF